MRAVVFDFLLREGIRLGYSKERANCVDVGKTAELVGSVNP